MEKKKTTISIIIILTVLIVGLVVYLIPWGISKTVSGNSQNELLNKQGKESKNLKPPKEPGFGGGVVLP